MKIQVSVLQTGKVTFGQVASYELVDLLGETMSVIRPTKIVWKIRPGKVFGYFKTNSPLLFLNRPSGLPKLPIPLAQLCLHQSSSTSLEVCPN